MQSIHESPKFVIQQTLHGYSDGHRLVAASCQLPREAESLMLILSDLSGPGGGDVFDPYLTGYPLESAGRYALACTWPAPEMGRPGCVWTHTLLLGEELLTEMNNPEEFLKLFARPSSSSGFRGYLSEMRVPELFGARERRTATIDEWTAWLGPRLLRAVYGSEAPYAVLSVPRYAAAEMPLLSVWRLQWPKLRARFTFCGGARAVRMIEGRPMDLQAALVRDVRRLDRGKEPPAIVPGDHGPEELVEGWVSVAAAAYLTTDSHNLVGFFNRIGDSLPGDPTLFRPAVTAYAILARSADAEVIARDLVSFTAAQFPSAKDEVEFKRVFLGAEKLTGLSEFAVIRALASTEHYEAFDASALQLRPRSAALWSSGTAAWGLMSQLLTSAGTPLSEEVLSGLIDAMPAERLLAALDADGHVLHGIVRRNPRIAAEPPYWAPPVDRQARAARALSAGGDRIHELTTEIIAAALDVGADPVAPDLVEVFGDKSVPVVLEWLNGSPERPARLPRGWNKALRVKSSQMLVWLCGKKTVSEETARFVLSRIDFAAAFPSDELTIALLRYLPVIEAAGTENGASIACDALKVALNATSQDGAELGAASLDVVYRAAMLSRLPDDAWRRVASDLPQALWWQDWDRCERLRKAVVQRFRSEQWPASSLVKVTKDDALFDTIVAELKDSWFGRRVLREAIDSGASGRRLDVLSSD